LEIKLHNIGDEFVEDLKQNLISQSSNPSLIEEVEPEEEPVLEQPVAPKLSEVIEEEE
jgi:hypothetical protein